MNQKIMHRIFGALAFLVSFVQYVLTVQPTFSFWDCGEFSAAATWQQVPHPPGAPLFGMVQRMFQIIIPFGDLGWRTNMESVVASAMSVLFLYLIGVKVINALRKAPIENISTAVMVYGSALVGALAFSFSDTAWFNGVESEVYASSTVLVAFVVYLMMVWYEKADQKYHEKYLLLIGYVIGLSAGVHLLSILILFTLAMVIYYRKFKYSFLSFSVMTIIGIIAFFIVYPGMIIWLPGMLAGNFPFKMSTGSNAVIVLTVAALLAAAFTVFYSKRPILRMACFVLVMMVVGYSSYVQIIVRAHANLPMNENIPTTFAKLNSYIGRDQYGDAPNWPRRYQTESHFIKEYEKYGKWYAPQTKTMTRADGSQYGERVFKKTNFEGEMTYMFKYQMYEMYWRYFLWNFVGRASDIQDRIDGKELRNEVAYFSSTNNDVINYGSGYIDVFPIRFWGLPLIFGLFGLFYHFKKDKKLAFSYLILFVMMGILATLQQNQQNPQPRERDYFYVGSFMVFAMWISIGVYALIDYLRKSKENVGLAGGVVLASLVLVPVNMAIGGWKMHSRAGNYLPFDYAYNILQSAEKDAIIITNGDNDTFPVWWIQDVAGVRRDVRIVNLSLGNTLWYVDQLKNQEPWGAKKLPLTFSDESLRVEEGDDRALTLDVGEARIIEIPVDRDILAKYTNDPAILNAGKVSMTFTGAPYGDREGKKYYMMRVQDKLVMEMIKTIHWTRPIYYCTSVGPDAECSLSPYFRLEGFLQRICPVVQRTNTVQDPVDFDVMEKTLMNVDNSDNYACELKYGTKFRNMSNMNVYYDGVHRNMTFNYRQLYMRYAGALIEQRGDFKHAVEVLDMMNKQISLQQFPLNYPLLSNLVEIYSRAGATDRVKEYATMCIEECKRVMQKPGFAGVEPYYKQLPPEIAMADSYAAMDDYDNARSTLDQIRQRKASSDPNEAIRLQYRMDQYDISKWLKKKDTTKAIEAGLKLIDKYNNMGGVFKQQVAPAIQQQIDELRGVKSNIVMQ